jgi:predicted hydrocarbon binding protein
MLQLFNATGWAKVELEELNIPQKKVRVKMTDGFECSDRSTGRSEGNFLGGVLAGALTAYFGSDIRVVEKKCLSKGDSYCLFETESTGNS